MKRSLLACVAGLLAWMVVVTVINRVLRLTMPDYTAAEHTLEFTLSMKWARLLMAIITSVTAGAVTSWVAPLGRVPPWIVGGVVLAIFVPAHISIWSRFPVWYHLAFLLTILPAVLAGSVLATRIQGERGNIAQAA